MKEVSGSDMRSSRQDRWQKDSQVTDDVTGRQAEWSHGEVKRARECNERSLVCGSA